MATGSRTGRTYWVLVGLAMLIVLVVTGLSVGWLTQLLNEPTDPSLSVGEQARIDLAARVALVDWVIRIGILSILGILAFLARRWMLTMERQAEVAEAQLSAAREQLELTQNQLTINQETAARQAELSEMNLQSDRFSRAVLQATAGSSALRAVGLLDLEELAVEHESQFAASVHEFLVALVKEKTSPEPEQIERLEAVSGAGERSLSRIPPLDSGAETALAILARNRDLFDRNVEALAADTASRGDGPGGTGLHLVDVDLTGCWLRGANLRGATLTNVRLTGAVLVDVDLTESCLTNCRLSDATIDTVDFSRARLHSSTFAESTFTDTVFERAAINAVDFGAAAITRTSFRRANATGTGFVGSVVTGSVFDEAMLTGTSFHGALFTDLGGEASTFATTTLSSVAFNEATFAGTNFVGAAINDADFAGARLSDVAFDRSSLRQTTFIDAEINAVSFDQTTQFDVRFDDPGDIDDPGDVNGSGETHADPDDTIPPSFPPPGWPAPVTDAYLEGSLDPVTGSASADER